MPQTIANHPCILPALFKSILSIQGSVWTFPFPKQSFHLLVYPEPPWVCVFCAGLAPRALPTFSSLLADIRNSPVLTPRSSFVYSGQRSCLLTGQRGTKPNHVWRVHFGMAEFHRRSQGSHCGSSQAPEALRASSALLFLHVLNSRTWGKVWIQLGKSNWWWEKKLLILG